MVRTQSLKDYLNSALPKDDYLKNYVRALGADFVAEEMYDYYVFEVLACSEPDWTDSIECEDFPRSVWAVQFDDDFLWRVFADHTDKGKTLAGWDCFVYDRHYYGSDTGREELKKNFITMATKYFNIWLKV